MEPSFITMVRLMIEEGLRKGTKQIHLCPPASEGREMEVKYQEGAHLQHADFIPGRLVAPIICRLKIASGCSIATKSRAQYGKIRLKPLIHHGHLMVRECEVFVIPTPLGELVIIQFPE